MCSTTHPERHWIHSPVLVAQHFLTYLRSARRFRRKFADAPGFHNPTWFEEVNREVGAHGYKNCRLRLIQPRQQTEVQLADASDPDLYATDDETFRSFSFEDRFQSSRPVI